MHFWTKRTIVGGLALLAALTMPASALASGLGQGKPATHTAPIQGTVTSVSSSTLQIQTKTSNVSVALGSSTRVTRLTTLSLSDLGVNSQVHLGMNKNTNTVNAIRVLGSAQKTYTKHSATGSKPKGKPQVTKHSANHGKTAAAYRPVSDGKVTTVTKNSITIVDRNGQSASYALASSVSITKVVQANLTDLVAGQTVLVNQFNRNGKTISSVLILKG